MPMNFPDMDSLKDAAALHGFRQPSEGETEIQYRVVLADHVQQTDVVESHEIRNKVGWDKFTDEQNAAMVFGVTSDRLP